MASVSPARSPRLPSPPPFPEVQIGPASPGIKSPGISLSEADDTKHLEEDALRRIRPGTKAADMASGPPLVPLSELDSPFQLQEHLKSLYYHHTRNPDSPTTTTQLTRETALQIATPPENVDRSLWLYELCRLLVINANDLVVHFFREEPPCSAQTCPEMRASEWQYLCAVHDAPKPCCAIDYSCHTLDWAANMLASQKNFPSRLTLGSEDNGGSQQGVKHLTNIMRRVYRIFAHAWFQHRRVFWEVEGHEGLYILFKTVCDVYNLIPEDNYTIPPEAEGLAAKEEDQFESRASSKEQDDDQEVKGNVEDATTTISTGATTRRHKHTPSFDSTVTTIAEGDEEDSPASPVKPKAVEASDAPLNDVPKEAPLAQLSKTAEKKVEPPEDSENSPATVSSGEAAVSKGQTAEIANTETKSTESDQGSVGKELPSEVKDKPLPEPPTETEKLED